MEKIEAGRHDQAVGGTLTRFAPPSGPGGPGRYFGYEATRPIGLRSLAAKLIVHGPD